jgi:predicted secreted protein
MSDPSQVRELALPLAKELGELNLICMDMETAYHAIQYWRAQYSPINAADMDDLDRTIALALFRDAIVQFVGCFDRTAEFSLKAEDAYKTEGQLKYFRWLRDLRDSYAAHKFGPYRQCAVGVDVKTRRVRFLTQLYRGPNGGDQLLHFMAKGALYAALRMKDLAERLNQVTASLTDDELNAMPIAKVHPVTESEVRMSRSAFERGRSSKGPTKKRST